MYCNKSNINILTSLLVAHGIRHVVVCPGSRNAPLVHNFNECPSLVCHLVVDERSAGFYALGMAQQLSEPVAVCVTSGSALLNVLPAVAEATYQNHGILVISADRPGAWIGQLDGQTMPQQDSLGSFVQKSVSLPEPSDNTNKWYCNRLVNEALLELKSSSRPSVHINVPVSEPLYEFDTPQLPTERIIMVRSEVNDIIASSKRPLIILGQLPPSVCSEDVLNRLNRHFAVLFEQISSFGRSYTEELIRFFPKDISPDIVIFVGGNTVSKNLRQYMRSLDKSVIQIVASNDGKLHDISMNTSIMVEDEDFLAKLSLKFTEPTAFADKIMRFRRIISMLSSKFEPEYSSMKAVKLLEEKSSNSIVYYANSLAVRYGMIFSRDYRFCNRGLNGIEGSLSVSAGASIISDRIVYSVIGDLSFFYDENALWQNELRGNFRILLLNNHGGGIFSGLQGAKESSAFNKYISAKQIDTLSAEGICHQFSIKYIVANDDVSLRRGLRTLCSEESSCPVLLEVKTTTQQDELTLKSYYKFISDGLVKNSGI